MADCAQATREERFRKLCGAYGIDLEGPPDYSGEEDAQAMLDPDDPDYELDRFCAVTHSGEYVYMRCYSTFDAARDYATENVDDGTYAESPGEIVDLDTGEVWTPDWRALPWKVASS